MNTITHTFNIKRAVLIVAIAGLLLSAFALPVQQAQAQSREALMAQLQQLLVIVAQLQAQLAEQNQSSRELSVGDTARTTDNLSVRNVPGGQRLGVASRGARGDIIGGPRTLDGNTWWRVAYANGLTGWSAGGWLTKFVSAPPVLDEEDDVNDDLDGSEFDEDEEIDGGVDVSFVNGRGRLLENNDVTREDDEGEFNIEFEVTAIGSDIYISDVVDTVKAGDPDAGFGVIARGDNDSGTYTFSVSSSADKEDGKYIVGEGETESFILTTVFKPFNNGFYGIKLSQLTYHTDRDEQRLSLDRQNIETRRLYIEGSVQARSVDSTSFAFNPEQDRSLEIGGVDRGVANIELETEEHGLRMTDVALRFEGGNTHPRNAFESISLWHKGDLVYERALDQLDVNRIGSDAYRIEFLTENDTSPSNFQELSVEADDREKFIIALSVKDVAIPNGGWNITIPDDGISAKLFDFRETVVSFGPSRKVGFDIVEEPQDSLIVRSSSENPDATTIMLDEDDEVEATVFAFELDASDSDGDIEVEEIAFDFDVMNVKDGVNAQDIIDHLILSIDGEQYDDFRFIYSGNLAEFDDIDTVIDAGEKVEAKLSAVFEAADSGGSGATFNVSVESVEAEGDNNDFVASGGAWSETHTLMKAGPIMNFNYSDETLEPGGNAQGRFEMGFEITAVGSDLYIDDSLERDGSGRQSGAGFSYNLRERQSGLDEFTGSVIAAIDSTAGKQKGRFVIEAGDTEEFTLDVNYTPAESGFYKLQLFGVHFNERNAYPDDMVRAMQRGEELESDYLFIESMNGEENPDDDLQLGTYMGYMNDDRFIRTENISEADALANCRLNADNNVNKHVYCTWNGKEIYRSEPEDEPELVQEAPEQNLLHCGRDILQDGSRDWTEDYLACYGIWDFGDSFGGDQDMCGGYSDTSPLGCEIEIEACASGVAAATNVFNLYEPWDTSSDGIPNPSDTKLDRIAVNLHTGVDVVAAEIVRLWEYRCTAPEQTTSPWNQCPDGYSYSGRHGCYPDSGSSSEQNFGSVRGMSTKNISVQLNEIVHGIKAILENLR